MGYAAFGTIEEFILLNGDVDVTGIDLLYTHPEASSTTVTSATIGCTLYTFEEKVVVIPPTETPKPTETPVTPAPVAPAATPVTPTSSLAETGFDMGGVYLFAGLSTIVLGAALAGLSAVALKRRKAIK
jgi:hypothetical protein